MARVSWIVCCLALLIKTIDAVDQNCNYYQDLIVGTTYYVYNPQYPQNYYGENSCMWTMNSDYRVNLTCNIEMMQSTDCSSDVLSVQVNSSSTLRYCGKGSFNVISEGKTMIVSLKSVIYTTGGRFLCEAQALKKPQETENCRCGWKNPTRIVGGIDAGVNEFPMMAGLVNFVNRNVFCGCTIISSRYAVTAGHCIIEKDYRELGVLVGDHDLSTGLDTNATVLHRVIQTLLHPNYFKNSFINDIGIVKTDRDITFSNQVGPVCLPFQHSPDTFGGNYVDMLGWGTTEFSGSTSDVLQKVTLSVTTNLECSKVYNFITSKHICTYGYMKDSCQMDSGGPVLWQNPTSRRVVLIGIISRGTGCGETSGVNTRVGAYVDWIVSATPDVSYCIIE